MIFDVRAQHHDTQHINSEYLNTQPGNTKGGSITVLLTSCLTGLDLSVLQKKLSVVIQLIPNEQNRRSMVQRYFPL
jgi:hypothetical protein